MLVTNTMLGGKTVVLKTLGLVALMARAGIPIPADPGARVDLFDPVLADIGDLQSVTGDLSTFSGHLVVRIEQSVAVLGRRGVCGEGSPAIVAVLGSPFELTHINVARVHETVGLHLR